MLARQPRSTQELAPLLGIGEAGLSRHLRLLARAGLVTTRRHGYYVLYALDREAIAALPAALLDFVDGEEAPARTQAPPPKAAT
jgi:DNA-binding transcriptional ArsR family regulator